MSAPIYIFFGDDPNASRAVRLWAMMTERDIRSGIRPLSDMRLVSFALEWAMAADAYRETTLGRDTNETGQPSQENE